MKSRQPRLKHVLAAFAVAPLAGALLVTVVAFFFAASVGVDEIMGTVVEMTFILTAAIGYAAAIVMGIPVFLLFRHLRWIRGPHWILMCTSIGAAAGAAWPAAVMVIGDETENAWAVLGAFLVTGSLVGAASGLLFARMIRIEPPQPDEIAATFD